MKLQYKKLQTKTNDTSINRFNLFQAERKQKENKACEKTFETQSTNNFGEVHFKVLLLKRKKGRISTRQD